MDNNNEREMGLLIHLVGLLVWSLALGMKQHIWPSRPKLEGKNRQSSLLGKVSKALGIASIGAHLLKLQSPSRGQLPTGFMVACIQPKHAKLECIFHHYMVYLQKVKKKLT